MANDSARSARRGKAAAAREQQRREDDRYGGGRPANQENDGQAVEQRCRSNEQGQSHACVFYVFETFTAADYSPRAPWPPSTSRSKGSASVARNAATSGG